MLILADEIEKKIIKKFNCFIYILTAWTTDNLLNVFPLIVQSALMIAPANMLLVPIPIGKVNEA